MSATLGNNIKLTVFGESHGKAVGGVLDGLRAGIAVDMDYISLQMARRAPGGSLSTPRKEADEVEILSGVTNGVTNGAPLAFIIRNTNTKGKDYENLSQAPRPSHSDYPACIKHNGKNDVSGGGHFSGRLTAVLVAAASIVRKELENKGVKIAAHLVKAGDADAKRYDPITPEMSSEVDGSIVEEIKKAQQKGDSVGGEIECAVTGVPVGVGEPFFDSVESMLAHMLFSVPGVKGLSFGNGDSAPCAYGSRFNDALSVHDGKISTLTNNSGGINGGLANGMPIIFNVKMRPTPSIFLPQQTVDLNKMCNTTVELQGRHDPCIALRAVPVIEACATLVIFDLMED